MQNRKTNTQNKQVYSNQLTQILKMLRPFGGPAIILTGLSLFSAFFSLSVVLLYVGALVLIIEICGTKIQCNSWSQKNCSRVRLGIIVLILCLLTFFSIMFLFPSAPLEIIADKREGHQSSIPEISQIRWHPEFTDLRLSISNPTDNDYKNVDIVLQPNEPIIYIEQISSVSGVSFIGDISKEQVDIGGVFAKMPSVTKTDPSGQQQQIDLASIVPRYRVRCQSIPKQGDIQLLIAIASVNCSKTLCFQMRPGEYEGDMRSPPSTLVPKDDINKDIFVESPPSTIKVSGTYFDGTYFSGQRERVIDNAFVIH